jgi:RHS repeat-associated protein
VTRYTYDGRRVIQERDGNNGPQANNVWGIDLSGSFEGAGGVGGLLARNDWGGLDFVHSDGGGNVTALVDGNQNVTATYRYDPYGTVTSSSGARAAGNPYRFSTKEFHTQSGLYYYGFRWYDPYFQHWLNHDPIQENGGINMYGFVGNDSINEVDPHGLDNSPPSIIIGIPGHGGNFNVGRTGLFPNPNSGALLDLTSIFFESLDWAMTANQIYDDPANPWNYAGLFPLVPSATSKVGKNICELTKLGYKRGKKWRDAMKLIQKGGDVNLGFIPTKAEALDMLKDAGIDINSKGFRIELPHGPPSTHTYPHINFPTPGGGRGTIRIE